jgi:hypothetical protein
MQTRRFFKRRLWVEELEPRVVLSASPGLPGIVPSLLHSVAAASTNWAGYAAATDLNWPQDNAVSDVRGTWTVPSVTGKGTAYSSVWVGIDGFNSSTVQQIGTDSDVVDGQAQYYAWYEVYPKDSFTVTSLTVHANDSISASVTYVGSDQFSLQLTNNTTLESFSITQTASGARRSSADWIVEAPSSSAAGVLPLAKFGTANITGASATIGEETGPIDNPSWQNASIDMVSRRGVTKATTSALDDTNTTPATSSFTVTRVSAQTATAAPLDGQTKLKKGPQDGGTQGNQTDLTIILQAAPQSDFNRALSPAMIGIGVGATSAPQFINMPASQQKRPNSTLFQTGGSGSNFRFDDAENEFDLADVDIPLRRLQEAPAPAVRPMPNREIPLAPQVPMQQNLSSRDQSMPAIINVEVATPDATEESRAVRSSGMTRTFVSVLGVVGAFTFFNGGGFLTRSRASDEREQFEWDSLHSK